MKFTDGYWLMRKGVQAFFPAQAYETEIDSASLSVFAPTHPVKGRGDTLGGPMLSVRFSSPMENVIRVQMFHHKGGQVHGPSFQVNDLHPQVAVREDDKSASLTSRLSKTPI